VRGRQGSSPAPALVWAAAAAKPGQSECSRRGQAGAGAGVSERRGGGTCRGLLGEGALGDDPVKQLAAAAELEHHVHVLRVLECGLQRRHVAVVGDQVQDLDLPPHVLDVLLPRARAHHGPLP